MLKLSSCTLYKFNLQKLKRLPIENLMLSVTKLFHLENGQAFLILGSFALAGTSLVTLVDFIVKNKCESVF